MEIFTVILLAIGLSFDSFAVSVCSGLNLPQIRFVQAAKIAINRLADRHEHETNH